MSDQDTSYDLQAVEEAIAILNGTTDSRSLYPERPHDGLTPLGPICQQWRGRAVYHLQRRVDAYLRERPRIDNEQIFQAMLKDTANELRMAGAALEQAAQALLAKQAVPSAKQAHGASQRALQAADGLVGS